MTSNTDEGLGCALACIGFAIAVAIIMWALAGFPGLAR